MSDIFVTRRIFTDKSTIGKLVMDDLELWTLEDTCRNRDTNGNERLEKSEKVYGETAIPSGSYEVIINESQRYGRLMPYLKDVPFFEGVRIHWGNYPKDTLGCILVGMTHPSVDMIGESKTAFDKLFPRIEASLKNGLLRIHIAGGYTAEEFKKTAVV